MNVDIAIDDKDIIASEVVEELIARQHLPPIFNKAAEDPELRECQCYRLVFSFQQVFFGLHRELSKGDDWHRLFSVIVPSQDGLDTGEKNSWGERLGNVVIGAKFEAQNDISLFALG